MRGIRELALVGMLVGLFVFGTQAAAARQHLIRHELDALGYALLVAAACALAGRTWWPRSTLGAVLVLVGTYLLIGYPYGPVLWAVSVAVFVVIAAVPAGTDTGATAIEIVAISIASITVLIAITAISVCKPWGRIRRVGTARRDRAVTA